ncbi:2-C-methyl-D-erythritol 4-phosphate cytidylyltransferase [Sporosarcina ureilytica]|uniref:2-C-methyl-D-erythritol 4-phosphate cytidylyltransferase n=1 Tax=Sporosarcina ureilytica TaxID=298596 RepID=A0A1D8JCR5_9BACL|nr:2-C-methyl-D-erythritol 4-phosphate cytidylyltransferase [Sporosarcina ureilytica]AOV06496.1 2-C-methyl-D-erythritol 4-phosphate cytidylyltransferase [Sporosarcina ureilytica]
MKYTVMIPAAGSGQRMGAGFNKLFLTLGEKPIFIHTLKVFEADPFCAGIILAVKNEEKQEIEAYLKQFDISKVQAIVEGGTERQYSVAACLEAYLEDGIVLVHDAARPFIRRAVIHSLVQEAAAHGAAITGVKAKDTMKLAPAGIVEETVNRDYLWIVQTPQAFQYEILKKASDKAIADHFLGTDESMLVERTGHPVRVVEGTYDNVKMTTQEDLAIGEILLKRVQQEENT